MKNSFLLFALGGLIIVSCVKKKSIDKIIYQGHIFDSIGGNAAKGIHIKLNVCNSGDTRYYCNTTNVGTSTTDSTGYFKIEGNISSSHSFWIFYGNKSISTGSLINENATNLYLK